MPCAAQGERVKGQDVLIKLAGSKAKGSAVVSQLSAYRSSPARLDIPDIALDGSINMSPVQWWKDYGENCPELQEVALKVRICVSWKDALRQHMHTCVVVVYTFCT